MPHPYSLFNADGVKAALIFTPCPGTQESPIDEALADLKAAGADALITVMPDDELADNNASSIERHCHDLGLAWFHLPVADDAAPGEGFESRWAESQAEISRRLGEGQRIAIHCKGGSGRTGLIAASLLISQGLPLEAAIQQIQTLRPKALQHPVHQSWIKQFASR